MAHYFLNDDGTITKKKKNENDVKSSGGFGALQEINLPSSNTNTNKNKNVLEQAIDIGKKAINLPTTRMIFDSPVNRIKDMYNIGKKVVENTPEALVKLDAFRRLPTSKKAETIGNTALSTAQIFGEGALHRIEGLHDWAADRTGGISDRINTKLEKAVGMHKGKTEKEINEAKNKSRQEMIKTDYTNKLMNAVGKEDYKDLIESKSLVKENNLAGQVVSELGGQSVNLLLTNDISKGMIPAKTAEASKLAKLYNLGVQSAPIYTTSYGQALQEAYQNGATQSEARRYAAGSAAVETMTEWVTSGIPGVKGTKGKGLDKWFEKLIGEGLEQPSKTLSKALLKSGYKLVGESTEEVLSDIINPYLKQFTYEYNKQKDALGNFAEASGKLPSKEDLLKTIIVTCITTGILEAPSSISDISSTIRNGNNTNIDIDGIAHANNTIRNGNNTNIDIDGIAHANNTIRNNENINRNEANINENTQNNINIPETQNTSQNGLNIPINENINTNQNIDVDTNTNIDTNIATDENTNPLENLQEFNKRQQEIKNQQTQEETNRRINTLEEQLEQQGNRILEESESQREAMIESFKEYLEEHNITNPTQQDINDSITDIMSYDNDLDFADTAKAEQLYNKYVKEYMEENNIPFNNGNSLKQSQLDIIKKSNPMQDDYHTGIRNVEDIKTLEETINDSDYIDYDEFNPDLTRQDIENAIRNGMITVYSSYPIENGVFVSPSKMEAESYSGNGKIYSKQVPINDIAWIDPTQGQYAKVLTIPTVKDFKQDIKLPTTENNVVSQETIDKYENATGSIDRNTLLEVAQTLDITHKKGVRIVNDTKMQKLAGHNQNPKILNVDNLIEGNNLYEKTQNAKKSAIQLYAPNPNEYTEINNKDIQSIIEIGRSGIKKTFNNNTSENKANTYATLESILEEGIYFQTTENLGDENILYHHFLTPVKAYDTEGNAFIRSVVKEITNNESLNKKFYYHQFEYLDNKKGMPRPGSLQSSEYQDFENIPSANNDTINRTKSQISLPTKYNMQQNEKNIPTKKILNPNEISKITKEDANTTPLLPQVKRNNKNATEESSFYKNATEKSKFLTEESRELLKDEEDIKYYEGISNEESLSRAKERLDKDGQAETLRWFQQDSKKASSTDIAEGWILLKQYQDAEDYESMVEVAKKMREIGTNAGQTVQAFNIMSRLTPEGMVKYAQSELSEAYNVMVKNKSQEWIEKHRDEFDLTPDEVQFIIDNMKEIQNMDDGYDKRVKLAEIQKMMTDKLPAEKGKAIKAWMRISMLFNPKTQVRNVMGNGLIAPVNYFGDMFSSYADKMIAKKTGVRTTGKANVKAILKGMKQGAYESYNDYKKGINTRDMEGNRFEIGEGKSFNEKTAIGRTLNRVDRLLNFVMDAGDRIFSQSSFENSLQNQMILNNTNEITQDMIDIAHQEALSRTWNDNNEYTKFVLGVRRGLNKIGFKGYGLGDVLIPFAKTPANLTKAIVDYSPAGMVKAIIEGNNLKKSLSNGQYTPQMQHQFVQDLGKATAGTMLYILGYALAKAGITTGESDDDKDTANFLKNTLGISSYSIKIGGKTFTYDWAQPIAAPLSITSNIVNKQKEDATLYDSVLSSLDTAGNILLQQSFLESLNTVFNNNKGVATGVQEAIMELPSRTIPTFVKQIADMTDGTQRQTFEYNKPLETSVNKIKSKIPGLNKTLAPSVDTMGREIQKYGGKNNIFNVFLNPANVNTENISDSAKEIYRLYKETGDTTIMPRVAPHYINKGEKITLNSQQREKYQKISGDIIEKSISELLKDSKYKNMSDNDKADVINNIVNYAYNKAENEVLGTEISNNYNKINQYINDGGTASNYYLNKEEIDYSYNNPEKYSVIKQIASYDKYTTYKNKITDIRNNTTNDKDETIKYINSLNMSVPQKAIFIKQYYKSFTNYDKDIIKYINNQNLTSKEKEQILTQLGFTVKDGRVY